MRSILERSSCWSDSAVEVADWADEDSGKTMRPAADEELTDIDDPFILYGELRSRFDPQMRSLGESRRGTREMTPTQQGTGVSK